MAGHDVCGAVGYEDQPADQQGSMQPAGFAMEDPADQGVTPQIQPAGNAIGGYGNLQVGGLSDDDQTQMSGVPNRAAGIGAEALEEDGHGDQIRHGPSDQRVYSPDQRADGLQVGGLSDDDQTHMSGVPNRAARIKAEALKKEERMKATMFAEDAGAKAEEARHAILANAEEMKAARREKYKALLNKALKVDLDTEKNLKKKDRNRGATMLVFFAVLTGVELDFCGFLGSFPVYWNLASSECPHYGMTAGDFNASFYKSSQNLTDDAMAELMGSCSIGILRILLVAMPVAYVSTFLAYMFLLDPDPSKHPSADVGDVFVEGSPGVSALSPADKALDAALAAYCPAGIQKSEPAKKPDHSQFHQKAMAMRVRVPVKLDFYHFTPLLRFVLIIRSLDENDIEGVFRVNSLSSFTLGSAQLMGLMFTFSNFDGCFSSINLFVWINICSQFINWSITIAYFATSVSRTMSNSMIVESYKANNQEAITQELLLLKLDVETDARADARASDVDEAVQSKAERRLKKVEWEIKKMKNLTVKLDCFLPQDILEIRRVLLQHWADEFANC